MRVSVEREVVMRGEPSPVNIADSCLIRMKIAVQKGVVNRLGTLQGYHNQCIST